MTKEGLHWIVKTTALVSVGIELELLQPMMKRINKHDMIQNVVMNTRSAETQSVATPRKQKNR